MSTQNIQVNITSSSQISKAIPSRSPEDFITCLENSLDKLCKIKALSESLEALRTLNSRMAALEDQIIDLRSHGYSCDQRNNDYLEAREQEEALFELIEGDISALDAKSFAALVAIVADQQDALT